MITIVVLGGLLLISQQVFAQTWIPVRAGIPFGISGIALMNQQSDKLDFSTVHDNKQPNQGRLAIISLQGENQPEYLLLNWPNKKLPTDLEALKSITDTKNYDFIAVNSHGKASNFQLDSNKESLSILKEFDLPAITKDSNFESSCLQKIDNQLIRI